MDTKALAFVNLFRLMAREVDLRLSLSKPAEEYSTGAILIIDGATRCRSILYHCCIVRSIIEGSEDVDTASHHTPPVLYATLQQLFLGANVVWWRKRKFS